MKLLLILFSGLILSGCGAKPPLQAYADDQVFEGYPCGDSCESFERGYREAEEFKFTVPAQCGEGFDSVTMGCKVYVAEFEIEQRQYDEIMNDFNQQFSDDSQ